MVIGERRQATDSIGFRFLIEVLRMIASVGSGRRLGLGMAMEPPMLWEDVWCLLNGTQLIW
jgi:hypothetical protein